MACGFPVRASAWIGWWCHSRRQHTEAPLPKSNLHLFLSVSVWYQSDEDLQSPSGEAEGALLFSTL